MRGLQKLGKPRPQVATVAAQQLNAACASVPEQAAEAIELGLVPSRLANRQTCFELSEHRDGGLREHELRSIRDLRDFDTANTRGAEQALSPS